MCTTQRTIKDLHDGCRSDQAASLHMRVFIYNYIRPLVPHLTYISSARLSARCGFCNFVISKVLPCVQRAADSRIGDCDSAEFPRAIFTRMHVGE